MTSSKKKLIILIAVAVVLVAVLLILLLVFSGKKKDPPAQDGTESTSTNIPVPSDSTESNSDKEPSSSDEPSSSSEAPTVSEQPSDSNSEPSSSEAPSDSQSGSQSEPGSETPSDSQSESTSEQNPIDASLKPVNDEIYINAPNVQARTSAVVHESTEYKVVHYGEKYVRTAKNDEWSLITVEGILCYVSNQYVTTTKPVDSGSESGSTTTPPSGEFEPCSTTYYVSCYRLKVRTSPSMENEDNVDWYKGFNQGDKIEPIATNGRWAKILIDGKEYYVGMTHLVTDRNQIVWLPEEPVTSGGSSSSTEPAPSETESEPNSQPHK